LVGSDLVGTGLRLAYLASNTHEVLHVVTDFMRN
jgi:hypothetical protein